VVEHKLSPGDIALICSDGLHGMINDQKILAVLTPAPASLEDGASRLIDAANEAGGKDNVSVVLVRYTA
jgi:protein phosphatase